MAYAHGVMDVRIYRETDEQLVAQAGRLREEMRQLEARLVRRSTPAQRFGVVRALRRQFRSLLDDEPTRLAAMLRQAGIRIGVEDGRIAGAVPR